jgi:hypothetical protein
MITKLRSSQGRRATSDADSSSALELGCPVSVWLMSLRRIQVSMYFLLFAFKRLLITTNFFFLSLLFFLNAIYIHHGTCRNSHYQDRQWTYGLRQCCTVDGGSMLLRNVGFPSIRCRNPEDHNLKIHYDMEACAGSMWFAYLHVKCLYLTNTIFTPWLAWHILSYSRSQTEHHSNSCAEYSDQNQQSRPCAWSTCSLVGGERSVSRSGRFTPGTHSIGG